MKKYLFLLLSFFLILSPLSAQYNTDELLQRLDIALQNKENYVRPVQHNIRKELQNLKQTTEEEKKYAIYNRLYQESQSYSCDSALHFAQEQLAIAQKLNHAEWIAESCLHLSEVYSMMGFYIEALGSLESIDPSSLLPAQYPLYLNTAIRVYNSLADYNSRNENGKEYLALAGQYRDQLRNSVDSIHPNHTLVSAECLMAQGDPEKAIALLNDRYKKLNPEDRHTAYIAYTLGEAYKMQQNSDKQIESYALSALSDVLCGVKENLSLRKLAVLLFENGDIERAYLYIKNSMVDSIFSGARLRTLEISEILPVIVESYQSRQEQQKKKMILFMALISFLVVILIVVLLIVFNQMRKIAQTRKELRETNNRLEELNLQLSKANQDQLALNDYLSESNHVKEGYIGHFLNLCSVYIEKLENYKKLVNRKIIAGQIEELQKMTHSDKLIESELKEFYATFDNTFLLLYPGFVDELNQLLKEESRFQIRKGEGLNTELRIFALIKLGITDSSRIAGFLRYSAQTIYNYRSKVKTKAIDKDDFEEQVKHIGLRVH